MVMREVRAVGIDFGHRQAFDVVAAAGEQADDARQHARLIVHQDGRGCDVRSRCLACVASDQHLSFVAHLAAVIGADRIISLCAAPDGIIG